MASKEFVKGGAKFIIYDRPNGLWFTERIAIIYSDYLEYALKAIKEVGNVNYFRLTTGSYKLNHLDFLKENNYDNIIAFDLLSDFVTNVEGLYYLQNLELINSDYKNIDYTRFPKLKAIYADLSNYSYKSFSELTKLIIIRLGKYKYDDVTLFSKNKGLKKLMLRVSKIITLKGLENFKELEELELYQNRRLRSLEGITSEHNKTLKKIIVYSAPKLFHINEYLSKLPDLEYLELNKLKKVDSLKFLDLMRNLKFVRINYKSIEPEDGDKEPLLRAIKRTNGRIF